ncbi:MAG: AMP-binding protein [Acidimicrobiales bacterium]
MVGMGDLLVAALSRNPDKPAVYLGDDVLTGGQVAAEVSRYSQAMRSIGIVQGTPTAVLALNRPEVLFHMGAGMIVGVRGTALHPMGSLEDHVYVLTDAGTEVLIVDTSMFAQRAADLRAALPDLRIVTFDPGDLGECLPELAAKFDPAPLDPARVDPDEVGGLAYTGGTTGKPKGVMMTPRGSITMTQIQLTEWDWPDEPRFLIATPLSHAGAAFFIPTLLKGGSVVVIPWFDPELVLETIEKFKITATMVVPTMLYVLLDHSKFAEADLSSLEVVYYGAAAMSPTRLAEAIDKLGSIFVQFYGQAECPMAITVLNRADHDLAKPEHLASCGRPAPWVRVALLGDEGHEVAPGDPGEICVQGPLVMAGYWNKPEQTKAAFAGGWLHTGDIARQDGDGYLYIVDRKKDMIVTGGFNVFPREIEDVIGEHPAIAQVAVIGVPDEKWGETVKAVVVARPGETIDVDELIALVKDRKGSVSAPKSVDVVDEIPVSALGKPDKKALRQRYWGDADRLVN